MDMQLSQADTNIMYVKKGRRGMREMEMSKNSAMYRMADYWENNAQNGYTMAATYACEWTTIMKKPSYELPTNKEMNAFPTWLKYSDLKFKRRKYKT